MLLYNYCVVRIQEQIKYPGIVEFTCTTEIGCNLENDLICVLWLYLKEYLNEQHWTFSFWKKKLRCLSQSNEVDEWICVPPCTVGSLMFFHWKHCQWNFAFFRKITLLLNYFYFFKNLFLQQVNYWFNSLFIIRISLKVRITF